MSLFQRIFSGRQSPYIVFTMAIVVWFVCLPLFQDGMFMDGLLYASVAHNLARGVGTFWNPVFSQNSNPVFNTFHEHPPLVFYIQSLFFKIFGLHNIYPERIYCLFTFLLTAMFMGLIWHKVLEGRPGRRLWWLPVLLWVIMPVVFWGYADDVQENTMTVFTTSAIYFIFCAMRSGTVWRSPHFYIGCICVFLASMSKGVPGIFPVVFFFIYRLVFRKTKLIATIGASIGFGSIIAASWFLVLLDPTAREAMRIWFFDRMLQRISNDPSVHSHFHILTGLFTEQIPAMGIVLVLLIIFRLKQVKNKWSKDYFMLFLLLGFSGSLPLMLTLVQADFYFLPALPLFSIAWGLLIADGLEHTIDSLGRSKKWTTAFTAFAWVAFMAGISATICQAGKIKRDKEVLHDIYCIQKLVPENSFMTVHSDIMWSWSARLYMMRYNSISFSDKDTCPYLMAYPSEYVEGKYAQINAPLHLYKLYKLK
jgi:hypothetical protein